MKSAEGIAECPVDKWAKYWLGRQDSNLRMAASKSGVSRGYLRHRLRNGPFIHRLISKTYDQYAERNRHGHLRSNPSKPEGRLATPVGGEGATP